MPTSTNMQSSTHLFLLVVVLVMVLKPLPHPGSPPTEDVMQKRGREKKKGEKNSKLNVGRCKTLSEKLTCLDRMAFFRSGCSFFIRLRHVASSAVRDRNQLRDGK